jgi:hypothetical protein
MLTGKQLSEQRTSEDGNKNEKGPPPERLVSATGSSPNRLTSGPEDCGLGVREHD